MQRSLRMNDLQLFALADKALHDNSKKGYLFKRTTEGSKWQLRWFVLYQNLFFYYDSESSGKPCGLIFLEGSYCSKAIQTGSSKNSTHLQHVFTISFPKEGSKQYEFKSETESECNAWVHCIDVASFSKMLLLKEELEQKHLHLVQIVETEKTAKSHYTQQCEELTIEIKKLRAELCSLKKEWKLTPYKRNNSIDFDDESEEVKKIKKVQSFFRGWLCRRRWKQIVEEYINSPHAENMRKRNSLVFRMVEAEEEYVEQLQLLVSCFLRPLKMAASSQKPPCSHDELNSIFLNSETIMFLHQIFLKGLTARMESWPTLVLGIGDLFDMLLPMLCIYQEYVRNHHFSLQVLAECKAKEKFATLLKRLEEKPVIANRTLETFLTYPMHQVPRYIITLHELLAHTPHNHVERRSLENAKSKLEELSRQMHDEVSETENIRKNLSIERIIIGGCDVLLDVNQVFIRQGSVLHLPVPKVIKRISSYKGDKEVVRQCFLFSNHILLCIRASNGKLNVVESVGRIPLTEATLIEEPAEQFAFIIDDFAEGSISYFSRANEATLPPLHLPANKQIYSGLDFKIIWDCKSGPPISIHLVAPTMQEKAAWTSDISQCIDNVHFNDLFHSTMSDSSSVTMPQSIRNDPRLYKDDVDIRFSRTLNSCKLPQIRYASPERLFERLTDLRFLSIDFLNTFLLTYRVFTDGVTVLEALKKVHYYPETQLSSMVSASLHDSTGSLEDLHRHVDVACPGATGQGHDIITLDYDYSRRISSTSEISDISDAHRESVVSTNSDTQMMHNLQQAQQQLISRNNQHWRLSYRKYQKDEITFVIRRQQRDAEINSKVEEEQARTRSSLAKSAEEQMNSQRLTITTDPVSSGLLSPGPEINVPVPPPPSPEVPDSFLHPDFVTESDKEQNSSEDSSVCNTSESDPQSENESFQEAEDKLSVPSHSQSSETLKADQSSPTSPTIISAAASLGTLVGSADSKSGSPRPSPVNKDAPQELPTSESPNTNTVTNTSPDESSNNIPTASASNNNIANHKPSSSNNTKNDCPLNTRNNNKISKNSTNVNFSTCNKNICKNVTQSPTPSPIKGILVNSISSLSSSASSSPQHHSHHHHHHHHHHEGRASVSICAPSSTHTTPTHTTSVPSGSTLSFILPSRISSPKFFGRGSTSSDKNSVKGGGGESTSSGPQYLKVRGATGKRGSSDTESTGYASTSTTPRSSFQTETTVLSTPRSSFQLPETPVMSSKAGVVVTSSRASSRRSSTASAASAFAVATAASSNPPDPGTRAAFELYGSQRGSRNPSAVGSDLKIPTTPNRVKRESVISTAATMRVLNVLRHWISKHSQDFQSDPRLMQMTTEFLEELVNNSSLLPAEHKAASQLLTMISKEDSSKKVDLDVLLAPPQMGCKDTFDTVSAMEIAESMTYLDHKIFISIQSEEFLGQAWMKSDRATRAPHILLMTRRFNEVSRLVASEIMRATDMQKRIMIIEKWAAVADICRMFHNFNGVLQICAAFTNSSVYRLKRTWERVKKTVPVRQSINKLQSLVNTDGRFRNMREALHRCDPPCIPYLGMYLTDLSFIEEGTPNFTEDGLLNFSKMRMIAHVIREVRQYQQTPYKIEMNPRAINYLLDTSRHLSDDELYQHSLVLEPRLSRLGTKITPTSGGSSFSGTSPSHFPGS
ncbi:ras-specific guanine nucleotide-releasing factor 2-like isoform X4 [Tetranychus urticae]|uniref:ras-specific guanine nucleotide-releasing factor 2-like isoform X4 n=1 Tax=Tetranychus urticae TaxID=32264 RepID=UPI00077BB240|nr:ras-specific guanine nucleotide-releasing factor 2-like isoform X4 [Tetranychus urticae]